MKPKTDRTPSTYDEAEDTSTSVTATAPAELAVATSLDDIEDDDRATEWVDVPEWNRRCLIRAMSSIERDALEKKHLVTEVDEDENGKPVERQRFDRMGFRSDVVALCWVHPTTLARVIDTDDKADKLKKRSATAIERLFVVGNRLSGISDEQIEKRKNGSRPAAG